MWSFCDTGRPTNTSTGKQVVKIKIIIQKNLVLLHWNKKLDFRGVVWLDMFLTKQNFPDAGNWNLAESIRWLSFLIKLIQPPKTSHVPEGFSSPRQFIYCRHQIFYFYSIDKKLCLAFKPLDGSITLFLATSKCSVLTDGTQPRTRTGLLLNASLMSDTWIVRFARFVWLSVLLITFLA